MNHTLLIQQIDSDEMRGDENLSIFRGLVNG